MQRCDLRRRFVLFPGKPSAFGFERRKTVIQRVQRLLPLAERFGGFLYRAPAARFRLLQIIPLECQPFILCAQAVHQRPVLGYQRGQARLILLRPGTLRLNRFHVVIQRGQLAFCGRKGGFCRLFLTLQLFLTGFQLLKLARTRQRARPLGDRAAGHRAARL